MTDEQVRTLVDETISWANDLSDQWTGTTMGNIIDSQKARVQSLAEQDIKLASIAVLELAQTCDYAEQQNN